METILKALGGVAIGVAAYTLGETVQERRAERGEEYGNTDLLDEWISELGEEGQKRKLGLRRENEFGVGCRID